MICSPENLSEILSSVSEGVYDVFGDKLENVILYGSYARGEADEYSDIDIMVLVNGIPRNELWKWRRRMNLVLSRIEEEWEYEILLSAILEDVPTFEKYADAMPFFRTVIEEGVSFVRERIH